MTCFSAVNYENLQNDLMFLHFSPKIYYKELLNDYVTDQIFTSELFCPYSVHPSIKASFFHTVYNNDVTAFCKHVVTTSITLSLS